VLKVFSPPVVGKYTEPNYSLRDEPLEKNKSRSRKLRNFGIVLQGVALNLNS